MLILASVIFIAGLQVLHIFQYGKSQNRDKAISQLEEQANIYGRLWGRMLISRQMFMDFSSMEGFQYPEDFVLLVEAIDADHSSPLAVRYRTLMKEVLGPIQHECLELIMDKRAMLAANAELSDLLLEYMLMSSCYKIIFSRWDTGDYTIHFSQRRFPPELIDNLQEEYGKTKTALDAIILPIIARFKVYVRSEIPKLTPGRGDKKAKTYYSVNSKVASNFKPSGFS